MRITGDENPSKQSTKARWADQDDETEDILLPPVQVIGPDKDGIKIVIEHKLNDDNKLVRITTTTRLRKLTDARLCKRAVGRRGWTKFGDAVDEAVGARLTMVSTEDILLEPPLPYGSNGEESKPQPEREGTLLMVCRTCGKKGEHWTVMCPYKDLSQPTESFSERDVTSGKDGATKGAYVPPNLRRGADRSSGSDVRRRAEENSVRVTNLSEDTREADLNELCRTFGPITRTYVANDQKTGICRGFGFVNFLNREDAERAIKVLNGYGYDNLILHVEWAAPRTN